MGNCPPTGLPSIILENRWLSAMVLPDVGTKIYNLMHEP